jgi:hypothetical protein
MLMQSANYMPEHYKKTDRLISKHYDYLRDSKMQGPLPERQIIGYSSKNFFAGEKHAAF